MPRSGDAQGEERRMPFIGPLKGKRKPHTSFRRHSRPFGQAYAPSEVSGILFSKNQAKGKTTFFLNNVQIKS